MTQEIVPAVRDLSTLARLLLENPGWEIRFHTFPDGVLVVDIIETDKNNLIGTPHRRTISRAMRREYVTADFLDMNLQQSEWALKSGS